ncbi:MAG: cardiolipin synthase [Planctomycetaceae bacterium]|nr:cardiolipin synthase [Planctomycetaceae bacterium]
MRTRTAQGAVAWFFALVLFPLVSLPLYWVFGRNKFEGYVVSRQQGDQHIQRQVAEGLSSFTDEYGADLTGASERFRVCEQLASLPFTRGNQVELLINGDATFSSIFEAIERAEKYILVQFYIIHDDQIGRDLKERLRQRAQEGVRVCLLYDEIGSHALRMSFFEDLMAAGAEVHPFHTSRGWANRFQLNFRNHRKIVIVDGEVAFVGGHNVGDEYLGRDPRFGHWRDTHLKLRGPAVLCVQLPFLEDWHWATETTLTGLNWEVTTIHENQQELLILPTGPADQMTSCGLMFLHLINSARERCWITSPYYVPSDEVSAALQLAALRGVDVRIMVPEKADHWLVYLSSYAFIEHGLSSGIRFFRYEFGFLHQKVMLIDDDLACVGTANLDNRSFRLNFEITAAVANREFAAEVEQMLLDDFEKSREMKRGELSRKPFLFQLACQTSRLLAPIQ